MSLGTELAAAVASATSDASYLRAIVQGPAAGAASLVALPNGALIKTLARIAQEVTGGFLPLAGGTLTGFVTQSGGAGDAMFSVMNNQNPLGMQFKVGSGGAGAYLWYRDNGFLSFGVNNGEIARLVPGIGLGIAKTPQVELDVAGRVAIHADLQSLLYLDRLNASNGKVAITLQRQGGSKWEFGCDLTGTAAQDFFIYDAVAAATRFYIDSSGHWKPGADNVQNIGEGSRRMGTIFAGTGALNTSDARYKQWKSYLRDMPGLVKAGLMIPEIIGSFQFLQSIQVKGQAAWDQLTPEQQANTTPAELGQDLARIHVGLTVQELEAIFDVVRVEFPDTPTPAQLGLYGRDPLPTKMARIVPRTRPAMVSEPFIDTEYELAPSGDYFIGRTVPKTRMVPAPPLMRPVQNPDGSPRIVKVGERPTAIIDNEGRIVMEPVMGPEMRPVPATETYEETVYDEVYEGEYILSTRPEQIHYLCIGAAHIARKDLEARVAVLEQAAA
jgi:hypothetical protein